MFDSETMISASLYSIVCCLMNKSFCVWHIPHTNLNSIPFLKKVKKWLKQSEKKRQGESKEAEKNEISDRKTKKEKNLIKN